MLQSLLAEGRPLLADGATGTNLFAMGLTSGDAPELWNETHPDRIRSLHQAFVDAGADIILTNSFGGNRRRLALHGLEARVGELNRMAAENARAVADKAGRRVVVAGSVGPTGDILAPLGPLSEDEAVEIFVEQIEGLRDGGADVVWIETMSAAEEIRAAARAAAKVGMPYTVTASFDTAGRTMMGVSPAALGALLADFDPKPLAQGANCGVGAADLARRHPRHERGRTRRDADRQGERRRAALAWGRDPLFRHAGTDGEPTRGSRSTAARGSSAAAAATARPMSRRCGAASTPTVPAPARPSRTIVAALGPLVAPAAAEPGPRSRRRDRT